jgi:hypothetical protein
MALGFVIFLIICVGLYLRFRKPKPNLGMAYAGDRSLVLYNSSAQVRSPIGSVDYGEPLQIEQQYGDQVEVRTTAGLVGWTSNANLITTELWQQEKDLDAKTANATPESQGHTRVISNLHLDAGRDSPRVRQLKKDVSVQLFMRQPVAVPLANQAPIAAQPESDTDDATAADNGPRKEDWWLVRARLDDKTYVSGWLLGRFVDLDVPDALSNVSSSSGMHIVAWFQLNPAADTDGHPVPQYLIVGNTGPEGQACDFTMMRVYTWAKLKAQYETAFVQSDLCGKLPLKINRMPTANQATIAFADASDNSPQLYRMNQTIVRRVKSDDANGKARP